MILDLNDEEYKQLIKLAYIGEWVINANNNTDELNEEAVLSLQRLMAPGVKTPIIDQDTETKEYFLATDIANQYYDEYIASYDNEIFWEELSERLAARDYAQKKHVSPELINREEEIFHLKPIEEGYRKEFEDYGLERLEINDQLI